MNDAVPLQKLEEMKRYYQSSASEFNEVFNRQGCYDQGPELNGMRCLPNSMPFI